MTRSYFLYTYFYVRIAFKIILLIVNTNYFMLKQFYKNRKKLRLNHKSSELVCKNTFGAYSTETLEKTK